MPARELDLLDRDLRPGRVLLKHGQDLPGLAEFVVGQARVEQHRGRVRVTGADLERLAEVGLAAVAVAGLELAPRRASSARPGGRAGVGASSDAASR